MPKFKNTKEYTDKLEQIKLSESSRARMLRELEAHADFHAVTDAAERVGGTSRLSSEVSHISVWQTALFRLNTKTMHVFAVLALMVVGGGTSLAAQGSVPGEFLYPVKIHINEPVRGALALGAEAETKLQAELLAERVEEAEKLEATGRLNGRLATAVEGNIASQYERATLASAEADASAETESKLSVTLGRLASLNFNNNVAVKTEGGYGGEMDTMTMSAPRAESAPSADGRVAHDDTEAEESMGMNRSQATADTDVAVSTMIALEPVEVGQLIKQTEIRIASLRAVLDRYKAEIAADVRAEFIATLNEADEVLIRVMVQSNLDFARELAYEASMLVGKVEAALSTMGKVKIDPDTGAIVDIDLSNPPAAEPDRGDVEPMPMPEPLPLPLPPETLETSGSAELEATSEISL